MPVTPEDLARKKRILEALRDRTLAQLLGDPVAAADLDEEAKSARPESPPGPDDPQPLVTPELLQIARAQRQAPPGAALAFFSSADVVIVPGFMGSELADETGGRGLIWLDPKLALASDRAPNVVADPSALNDLLALRLEANDGDPQGARVRPRGAIPLIYGGLKYALEFSGYDVRIFGFDWRKHVDASAAPLAELLKERAGRRPRPLHLIAHSQGSLVARRALQMAGPDVARRVVNSLVLLGPATAGTFSAAFAIAGSHDLIDTARRWGLNPPAAFTRTLQSMTGLYQLLPWRAAPVSGGPRDAAQTDGALKWVAEHADLDANGRPTNFRLPGGETIEPDPDRMRNFYGWGRTIDASFMNDRTTIVLGDAPTVGGVTFDAAKKKLVPDDTYTTTGDGTVPDVLARIDGVERVFKAQGAEHMMLPATWAVIMAVRDVLADRHPQLESLAALGIGAKEAATAVPVLAKEPVPLAEFFGARRAAAVVETDPKAEPTATAGPPEPPARPFIADVSPPPARRLKVFSFDPLFASELENLGAEQVTVELPWAFADGDQLQPGPVGEYIEVIDFDASSRCFYPPVDLNHPHVLAQDGLPVSEGDPRFHQQMVYAVAMNTIHHFEAALGRAALWAPNLPRDRFGNFVAGVQRPGEEYVGRLRIYPHAMRQRNAFYSPAKKALLLGYFPAEGPDVGRNLPGGMVFSSLSYDIIAHETTHALLDGVHRHFTHASNPDVFAFHEAFADLVALFQHFSHPQVLRHQLAKARGDLGRETALGVLAAQFGEATGQRGALREYVGRVKLDKDGKAVKDGYGRRVWEPVLPDPSLITNTAEPHARGAILVAAVFRAFLNIYENRVRDLRRMATGGTGRVPDGDISPDLVNRLADEAAKSAKHVLRMCVRALDYVPPVDITFGEYLRALITADYDLVRDDDLGYRVAVVSAFRDWGIYPDGVRSLSVDSLLWSPPDWQGREKERDKKDRDSKDRDKKDRDPQKGLSGLRQFFAQFPCQCQEWTQHTDRRAAYTRMNEQAKAFHDWLADPKNLPPELAPELGLRLDPDTAPRGIRRGKDGKPVFHVHTFRPCRRIGPDGQQITDVVVEILQRRLAYRDETEQKGIDEGKKPLTAKEYDAAEPDFYFRGGCTLILDPLTGVVRYGVRKSVADDARLARERAFRKGTGLAGSFLAPPDANDPFAALHSDDGHQH